MAAPRKLYTVHVSMRGGRTVIVHFGSKAKALAWARNKITGGQRWRLFRFDRDTGRAKQVASGKAPNLIKAAKSRRKPGPIVVRGRVV